MNCFNILCIDDQETNLFLLESYLKQENDLIVHTLQSADEGLKWLLHYPVDLIILDIIMPEMDGFEMASRIRANPVTKSIPIIFITVRNDDRVIQEAFDNGGNDYICKPVRSKELIARVRLQLQLSAREYEIKQKLHLIEKMVDKQNNLIFITDGTTVTKANKAFLDYSGVADLQSFNAIYPNINQYFMMHSSTHHKNFITDMIHQSFSDSAHFTYSKMIDLLIEEGDMPVMFKTDAVYLGTNHDFIITLTDVSLYQEEKNRLIHYATHDHLTGLYNRRAMYDHLNRSLETAHYYGTPFSVILFDVDDFKGINDTHGHLEGDKVLINIAQHLHKMRKSDIGCRYGGEEFLVILPETKLEDAFFAADTLRMQIQNDHSLGLGSITCSFGIAQYDNDTSVDAILSRADNALYHAKANGKNRIENE